MLPRKALWTGALGVGVLLIGLALGLFVAPPEKHMGDVQRIMYVHVPSAWVSLLCFTAAFVFGVAYLWSGRRKWDDRLVGSIEAGVVLCGLLLVQGMIWGRATWGVWWDWDVRLTTSLVMFLLFTGVLALRRFAHDEGQRATWSAIATVVAFVDVPLVYFCVRWWRSLHQIQSSPETVDSAMVIPLRISAIGMLLFAIGLAGLRAWIERRRRLAEVTPLPERVAVREGAHA